MFLYKKQEKTDCTPEQSHSPKITITMTTYNRADMLPRAVNSVLKQTYQDFEVVIVANGSQDHTPQVLERYKDNSKIRLFRLEENRGPRGGYNYALDQIKGEWFTFLGDDDIIFENCLETMIRVPQEIDSTINAVTCNVIDSTTGKFAGRGLNKDQYLPLETIVKKTEGVFFGITKTKLLGDLRLNVSLNSHDDAFFYKIDAIANRYYIHKALRLFNTADYTESSKLKTANLNHRVELFQELYKETFYLDALKKYNLPKYIKKCFVGLFFMKIARNDKALQIYQQRLSEVLSAPKERFLLRLIRNNNPWLLKQLFHLCGREKLFNWTGLS